MPTYDYKCKNCGYKFELYQSIKDDVLVPSEYDIETCDCDNKDIVRIISATNFTMNGGVFKSSNYKDGSGLMKEPKLETQEHGKGVRHQINF